MFGLGLQELSIIAVIIVLVVGMRRWPQLKASATEAVQNLRDGISGDDEIDVTPPKERDSSDDERD